MQAPRNVGKSENAFTIVEMMTVVAIVAIMFTAALPGYENFVRNNEANVLASRLADSFRLAQAAAIREGIPVSVCPIDGDFVAETAFENTTTDTYPCISSTTWDAWKVFIDPGFNATVDETNTGWGAKEFVDVYQKDTITTNINSPITFDVFGFANLDPANSRSGWSWSNSFNIYEWSWAYTYSSAYSGDYYRVFMIVPPGCTGNNARAVEITQNGVITITNVDCYGS